MRRVDFKTRHNSKISTYRAVRKQFSLASISARIIFLSMLFIISACFYQKIGSNTVEAASTDVRYKFYTSIRVGNGDNLYKIADRYISDEYKSTDEYIDEVRRMNYLDEDCKIHEGKYIIIPYYSLLENKSGESLDADRNNRF